MSPTIRLDLEQLQALPLDLPARLTLWRELRALRGRACQPQDAAATTTDAVDVMLRRLLLSDQLSRCRELALQGQWCDASERLASLRDEAEALDELETLARLLLELLEPLQGLLVAPGAGPPCPEEAGSAALDSEDRAELLWQAQAWQQLIRERGLAVTDQVTEIAELFAHQGAIAWLERLAQAQAPAERLRALIRSQACLIQLAEMHQPCPDWVEQALRAGVRTGLNWLGRGLEAAELLRWSHALIESVLPETQRRQARQRLWPAQAALEVGRGLRLQPFTCH